MKEIWKSIKGYEGLYDVSNCGRVRSYHNNKHGLLKEPKIITGLNGLYATVYLSKNNIKKTHYVHRLVAEHFIANPYHLKEVDHIDGDKMNNCVTNLEWVSHEGNMHHASTHKLFGQSKEVYCVEDDTTYPTITELAKHLGLSQPRMSVIVNHIHRYKNKTYILKEV